MIKKLSLFLLTFLLVFSFSSIAFAYNEDRVVDNADLLTDAQEAQLEELYASIYNEKNIDVVFVTVTDLEGKTVVAYSDDYFDYNGYGYGDNHDGCLLLIKYASDYDREYSISTCGSCIKSMNDARLHDMEDAIIPLMQDGNFYGAGEKFGTMAESSDSFFVKFNIKGLGIALIISLFIAFIIGTGIMKKYKPVQFNRSANNYLVNGSLQVRGSYDNFLYSHVSRVKIESNSGSGGSSTHTSSSGRSHGGTSGRF